jgi:hypothetical protein
MDWIKKNYHQLVLGLAALALLSSAAVIALNSKTFDERFAAARVAPPRSNVIPPLEMGAVSAAAKAIEEPPRWLPAEGAGSLFVSAPYLLDPNTKQPRRPGGPNSVTHPPVPDDWLLKNNLNLLSLTVLDEDPDKDGFSNRDEYLGGVMNPPEGKPSSTDPNDPKSHPAYYTKLFFQQFISVPFRLRFDAYDGDPKKDKDKLELFTFQINTRDLGGKTQFVKLGEVVVGTKFKVQKFEYKMRQNPATGADQDVSELTLLNTETGDPIQLVLNEEKSSPDSYAVFSYRWPSPAIPIKVKKLQKFGLKPESTAGYKLLDVKATEALIELPSGGSYAVPLLQR